MAKKRFNIREEHEKQKQFQATTKRRIFEFMTDEERRKRTCKRSWELDVYLDKILKLANDAQAKGETVTLLADREGDQVNKDTPLRQRVRNPEGKIVPGDEYYHHRRSLQNAGVSEEEIRQREVTTKRIQKAWRKKRPEQKIRDYYAVQAQKAQQGLLPSSCHVIQVAVLEDKEDECTFILQATQLVETEYGGERRLPPKFGEVLTHPAMRIVNISMFDDLAHIVNSFYGGRLIGIKYADMEDIMADRWGRNCEKNALDMFHRAFPDLTWPKDILIAMSHWWVKKLTEKQLAYAFADPVSIKMILNATNDDATHPIDHFCVTFPDRRLSAGPSGVSTCPDDFDSDICLSVTKSSTPDWFFPVCQAAAARFPAALMPCNSPLEIHFLLRHIYGLWKESEKNRIRELTTGSGDCDWEDIDNEPTNPDRLKSTREGFEEFLNAMLDGINADGDFFSSRQALDNFLFEAKDKAIESIEQKENVASVVHMDDIVFSESEDELETPDPVVQMDEANVEFTPEDEILLAECEQVLQELSAPAEQPLAQVSEPAQDTTTPESNKMETEEPSLPDGPFALTIDEEEKNQLEETGAGECEVLEASGAMAPENTASPAPCSDGHPAPHDEPSTRYKIDTLLQHPSIEVATDLYGWRIQKIKNALWHGKQEYKGVISELPSRNAPEYLAAAARTFSTHTKIVDATLRATLSELASLWEDNEKARFLKGFASAAILDVSVAAKRLKYGKMDPMLNLSSCLRDAVTHFEDNKGDLQPYLDFYTAVYNMPLEERMSLARKQAFYHDQQQLHYFWVLDDAQLKSLIGKICKQYGLHLPTALLRKQVVISVSSVANAVTEGRSNFQGALQKVLLLGEEVSLRPLIMQALSFRSAGSQALSFRCAQSWGLPSPGPCPNLPTVQCNLNDRFHQFIDDNQRIRNADEMKRLIRDVIAPVDKLLLFWHYSNDLRCPAKTIAVLSIRPVLTATVYHFFVVGNDALPADSIREFISSIGTKEIRSQASEVFKQFCNTFFEIRFPRLRSLGKHISHRGESFLNQAAQIVLQQNHCCVHFDDLVTNFDDCSPSLFQHISASLFVLEWFPWDEPVH